MKIGTEISCIIDLDPETSEFNFLLVYFTRSLEILRLQRFISSDYVNLIVIVLAEASFLFSRVRWICLRFAAKLELNWI